MALFLKKGHFFIRQHLLINCKSCSACIVVLVFLYMMMAAIKPYIFLSESLE